MTLWDFIDLDENARIFYWYTVHFQLFKMFKLLWKIWLSPCSLYWWSYTCDKPETLSIHNVNENEAQKLQNKKMASVLGTYGSRWQIPNNLLPQHKKTSTKHYLYCDSCHNLNARIYISNLVLLRQAITTKGQVKIKISGRPSVLYPYPQQQKWKNHKDTTF